MLVCVALQAMESLLEEQENALAAELHAEHATLQMEGGLFIISLTSACPPFLLPGCSELQMLDCFLKLCSLVGGCM